MKTLAFVVPAYQRFELAAVCLRQLAATCGELLEHGIRATAVVVADDANLDVADELGFATVKQENLPFGRKWNDGIEYAARYLEVDYVVPFGTDNMVLPELIAAQVPKRKHAIGAHRRFTIVHQDGWRGQVLNVDYEGGDGIRVIPAALLEPVAYRPAEDDRARGIDTSIWNSITRAHGKPPKFEYVDVHPLQVVGFQSADVQLNDYSSLRALFSEGDERRDIWEYIRTRYPAGVVDEARQVMRNRGAWRILEFEDRRPMAVVPL